MVINHRIGSYHRERGRRKKKRALLASAGRMLCLDFCRRRRRHSRWCERQSTLLQSSIYRLLIRVYRHRWCRKIPQERKMYYCSIAPYEQLRDDNALCATGKLFIVRRDDEKEDETPPECQREEKKNHIFMSPVPEEAAHFTRTKYKLNGVQVEKWELSLPLLLLMLGRAWQEWSSNVKWHVSTMEGV